ncbi:SOS response-associated peptidase family protein [Xanthomonas translucens]|uniref:SOS response-associated peptidase family protein n=1 Tax=Xanthomonas campestris pv. translucens TaxID=343 RepID=UPI00071E7AC2|nr:SOS response-associated peptidase family protein [Xanthomonas translucens]KTF41139.1 hypothetical protein OZ12_03290 [Xanthomonas translucens pv. translucens]KWV12700.1 hypothetical protein ATB54_03725 [Xanthomonas translucens]MCS3360064.1 SOS response-associated peptidase [Xanthomonas translucens pv. translucens]MCS3373963.1 SOS response-associated peptidase [Xanthomonas translucens pv. translucens]MCT8274760.1 SOS response-associated peptidase [Xanthomonas translucens pv. translucens]
MSCQRSRIFAAPWKSRHCLIPLSGYYKWDRSRTPAQPYYIHLEPVDAAAAWPDDGADAEEDEDDDSA